MADPASATDYAALHTLWNGVITIGGLVVAFFTKRLVDQVDAKADKCDVDDLKTAMRLFLEREDRERQRQDLQHTQNTQRLDMIILELGNRKQ